MDQFKNGIAKKRETGCFNIKKDNNLEQKFGLDIDDVCADFLGGYCEKFGVDECKHWYSHYKTREHLEEAIKTKDFYLSLKLTL